jgi:hypothetical protein
VPEADVLNMHCHSFFSFNAYGYSPSSLVWLARRRGFRAVGLVDFDVLDAVDEFLAACDLAGVRGGVGLETRVYIPEFITREINSPGEPGIAYFMGTGFASSRVQGAGENTLEKLRFGAEQRNREMVTRVNEYLHPLSIDYERDVLPLTPSGNATERHLLLAYVRAAEQTFPHPLEFWAQKLGLPPEEVARLGADAPQFQNVIRQKLMKRGGPGYVQPRPESFPAVDEVCALAVACGALPCYPWLDGTSAGEQAIEELLELLLARGVAAVNVVPDRNWNVPDPEKRKLKVEKLFEFAQLAEGLALPMLAGTEMNSFGQKLVDDFDVQELAPLRQRFLEGAYFLHGHTMLQRALGFGYQSLWARAHLPSRPQRNRFYTQVGRALPPGQATLERIATLGPQAGPEEILAHCRV